MLHDPNTEWEWENFTPEEMACKCCGQVRIDEGFMDRLQYMRENAGFQFKINSAYRCRKHNKRIGGASNSAHTQGRAVDIGCSHKEADWLIDNAKRFGFTGRGVNQKGDLAGRFVHLDDLLPGETGSPRPHTWSY